MPETPIYGWPYEHPVLDEPGITLHGGALGQGRILAEEIEATVSGIAGQIAGLASDLDTLAGVALQRIATIDTGAGTNTTEFTQIPQGYRALVLLWRGTTTGSGQLASLALRFNGDSGSNYHSRLARNTAAGDYTSTDGSTSNYVFTVLRAGYVGTARSSGMIIIPAYTANSTKTVFGVNMAVGASSSSGGDNIFTVQAAGQWLSNSPVTAIRIWPSGETWAFTPHLTLLGVP